MRRGLCHLLLSTSPARLFVPLGPVPLDIPKGRLHLVDDLRVPGVLSDIIADFDSGRTIGGGELDDDVEGDGLGARGGMGEVVCSNGFALVLQGEKS